MIGTSITGTKGSINEFDEVRAPFIHKAHLSLTLLIANLYPQLTWAIPLRVLAATELRIEPSVRADRLGFVVRVRLRDDRAQPVQGTVRVRATPVRGPSEVTHRMDTQGTSSFDFSVGPGSNSVIIRAEFAGDSSNSPASVQLPFSLDAEFVEVGLALPSTLESDGDPASAVIAVDYANVVRRSAANLPVVLLMDDQEFARGQTDATGRASVQIDPSQLQNVGVHRFRATTRVGTVEKSSPERRVVVRALTSVVARIVEGERDGSWITVRGAVAWRGGGVANAMVRLATLGAQLNVVQTDARGAFSLRVDTTALEPSTRGRVIFSPTTPWYSGAESEELLLVPASPKRISWRFVALPLALMIFVISVSKLRANKERAQDKPLVIDDATSIVHSINTDERSSTLRVEVYDRSTGATLDQATVVLNGATIGLALIELESERNHLKVACWGFAPRKVELTRVRGKSSVLRVGLSNWREYAFGFLRPLLPKRGKNSVLSTVEEVAVIADSRDRAVLREGERVVYGPESPSEEVAATLKRRTDTEGETER